MNALLQATAPGRDRHVHVRQPRDVLAPRLLAMLAVIVGFAATPLPVHAQGMGPRLLAPATVPDNARYSSVVRAPAPGVSRQRPVELDLRSLDGSEKSALSQMQVDLFDSQAVTLTLDRLERRGERNYTWHGKVAGHPNGFALITVVDGNVSGTIELGDPGRGVGTRFQLQSTADGLTLLQELDASTFPEDHPGGVEPMAPSDNTKSTLRSAPLSKEIAADGAVTKADSAATIDVMIVYSNQTAAAAGAGIGAQVQQAIDTANLVYANSGITTRLRLVYTGPANYDESGDFNTDLNHLTSGSDGYMDSVATLRDTYGADLVSLFVENGQYCGMGWIGPSANYAFSVINRGCASGNLSFPHELGHNFGARHDTYVDAATTPYSYGHGWVDVGQRWRDVMAYNNACAAYGVTCTRIAYLSNPNMTYGNPPDPLGSTSTADTTRVHNQNALTVANFRASKVGGTSSCTWSLAPGSASVPPSSGAGSIGVTTQSGCAWNAVSNASWLSIGASASGAGTLAYSWASNTGPARNGTITLGGVAFSVSQASGCTYALATTSATVPAGGASGSTSLTTASNCTWTAASSAAWLTLSSAASGTGAATVGYVAAPNTGAARSANLTVGGQTLLVSQAAATTTIAPAVAALNPGSIDFGTVVVGKTSTKSATVSNSGGGTLTITALSVGGANPAEFTRRGTCGANTALAAGASCTVSITFSPAAIGTRSATVAVTTSSGGLTLNLAGTGKKPGRK
jgi:hypothetical protein